MTRRQYLVGGAKHYNKRAEGLRNIGSDNDRRNMLKRDGTAECLTRILRAPTSSDCSQHNRVGTADKSTAAAKERMDEGLEEGEEEEEAQESATGITAHADTISSKEKCTAEDAAAAHMAAESLLNDD